MILLKSILPMFALVLTLGLTASRLTDGADLPLALLQFYDTRRVQLYNTADGQALPLRTLAQVSSVVQTAQGLVVLDSNGAIHHTQLFGYPRPDPRQLEPNGLIYANGPNSCHILTVVGGHYSAVDLCGDAMVPLQTHGEWMAFYWTADGEHLIMGDISGTTRINPASGAVVSLSDGHLVEVAGRWVVRDSIIVREGDQYVLIDVKSGAKVPVLAGVQPQEWVTMYDVTSTGMVYRILHLDATFTLAVDDLVASTTTVLLHGGGLPNVLLADAAAQTVVFTGSEGDRTIYRYAPATGVQPTGDDFSPDTRIYTWPNRFLTTQVYEPSYYMLIQTVDPHTGRLRVEYDGPAIDIDQFSADWIAGIIERQPVLIDRRTGQRHVVMPADFGIADVQYFAVAVERTGRAWWAVGGALLGVMVLGQLQWDRRRER